MPERVKPPLVVDVDGTLVRGDLLIEGALRLLSIKPLDALALPFRAVGGRAALKRRVAGAVPLPPETLALNPAVVDEIAAARSAGREVWLASAADELAVAPLAEAVGATGFLASDGRTNLAGDAKAAVLVERFGEGGFDYIGNERRDLSVWKHARRAIGVGLSPRLARAVRRLDKDALLLPGPRLRSLDCLRALRPHQWVKNVLAFAPLIAAHNADTGSWLTATGLFLALSACASSAYLFNDLVDLPHDRGHRSKRYRPMAAGTAPLLPMAGVGAALAAGGLAAAFLLSAEAGLCVLLYLVATLAYSLWLKRKLFIDIVALAGLYELRVIAGSMAVSVSLSAWFLAFFVFAFLALAAVKRQSELRVLSGSPSPRGAGRAWTVEDLPVLTALGASSSFASAVVLALYIQSPETSELYARPEALWPICLLLVYWLGRMALLANRGSVDDDPVVFAITDRTSWLVGLAGIAMLAVAR